MVDTDVSADHRGSCVEKTLASGEAGHMEIVQAMVRGRAIGKGLVRTRTSLAVYPTE